MYNIDFLNDFSYVITLFAFYAELETLFSQKNSLIFMVFFFFSDAMEDQSRQQPEPQAPLRAKVSLKI